MRKVRGRKLGAAFELVSSTARCSLAGLNTRAHRGLGAGHRQRRGEADREGCRPLPWAPDRRRRPTRPLTCGAVAAADGRQKLVDKLKIGVTPHPAVLGAHVNRVLQGEGCAGGSQQQAAGPAGRQGARLLSALRSAPQDMRRPQNREGNLMLGCDTLCDTCCAALPLPSILTPLSKARAQQAGVLTLSGAASEALQQPRHTLPRPRRPHLQQVLVVGARINGHRHARRWHHAAAGGVQRQSADGDADRLRMGAMWTRNGTCGRRRSMSAAGLLAPSPLCGEGSPCPHLSEQTRRPTESACYVQPTTRGTAREFASLIARTPGCPGRPPTTLASPPSRDRLGRQRGARGVPARPGRPGCPRAARR